MECFSTAIGQVKKELYSYIDRQLFYLENMPSWIYSALIIVEFLQQLAFIFTHPSFWQQYPTLTLLLSILRFPSLLQQYKLPSVSILLWVTLIILLLHILFIFILSFLKPVNLLKYVSSYYQILTILLNICLLCLKTIFFIPMFGACLSAILTRSVLGIVLGSIALTLLLITVMMARFIMVDFNPFTKLPFSSFNQIMCIPNLILSIGSVIYFTLDQELDYFGPFLLTNMVVSALMLIVHIFSYKPYDWLVRNIEITMISARLSISIWITLIYYLDANTLSTFIVGVILLLPTTIAYKFVLRILDPTSNMLSLLDTDLESFLVFSILLIQSRNERESRQLLLKVIDAKEEWTVGEWFTWLSQTVEEHHDRQTSRALIMNAQLQFYVLQKKFKALITMTQAGDESLSIGQEFMIFRLKRMIENKIIEQDITKGTIINRFLAFNLLFQEFMELVNQAIDMHINFWKDRIHKMSLIEEMGEELTELSARCQCMFQRLMEINSTNYVLLKFYGSFLLEAEGKTKKAQDLLEKALILQKSTKNLEELGQSKYGENSQTIIIFISVDIYKIGQITNANRYISRLGYTRSTLIGDNISTMMPRVYYEHHNQVLINFINRKQELYSFVERNLVALTYDRYLIPVTVLSKIVPDFIRGIEVVGFLKQDLIKMNERQEEIYLLASSNDDMLQNFSRNATDVLGLNLSLSDKEYRAGMKLTKLLGFNPFDFENLNKLESHDGIPLNLKKLVLREDLSSAVLFMSNKRPYFNNWVYLFYVRVEFVEQKFASSIVQLIEKPDMIHNFMNELDFQNDYKLLKKLRFNLQDSSQLSIIKIISFLGIFLIILLAAVFITQFYFDFQFTQSSYSALLIYQTYQNLAILIAQSISSFVEDIPNQQALLQQLQQTQLQLISQISANKIYQEIFSNKTMSDWIVEFTTLTMALYRNQTEGLSINPTIFAENIGIGLNLLLDESKLGLLEEIRNHFQRNIRQLPVYQLLLVAKVLMMGLLIGILIPLTNKFMKVTYEVISLFSLINEDSIRKLIIKRSALKLDPNEKEEHSFEEEDQEVQLKNRKRRNTKILQLQQVKPVQSQHNPISEPQNSILNSKKVILGMLSIVLLFIFYISFNYYLLVSNYQAILESHDFYINLYQRTILIQELRTVVVTGQDQERISDIVTQIYQNENLLESDEVNKLSGLTDFKKLFLQLNVGDLCQLEEFLTSQDCANDPILEKGLKTLVFLYSDLLVNRHTTQQTKRYLTIITNIQEQLLTLMEQEFKAYLGKQELAEILKLCVLDLLIIVGGVVGWILIMEKIGEKVSMSKCLLNMIPIDILSQDNDLRNHMLNKNFNKLFD